MVHRTCQVLKTAWVSLRTVLPTRLRHSALQPDPLLWLSSLSSASPPPDALKIPTLERYQVKAPDSEDTQGQGQSMDQVILGWAGSKMAGRRRTLAYAKTSNLSATAPSAGHVRRASLPRGSRLQTAHPHSSEGHHSPLASLHTPPTRDTSTLSLTSQGQQQRAQKPTRQASGRRRENKLPGAGHRHSHEGAGTQVPQWDAASARPPGSDNRQPRVTAETGPRAVLSLAKPKVKTKHQESAMQTAVWGLNYHGATFCFCLGSANERGLIQDRKPPIRTATSRPAMSNCQ